MPFVASEKPHLELRRHAIQVFVGVDVDEPVEPAGDELGELRLVRRSSESPGKVVRFVACRFGELEDPMLVVVLFLWDNVV